MDKKNKKNIYKARTIHFNQSIQITQKPINQFALL